MGRHKIDCSTAFRPTSSVDQSCRPCPSRRSGNGPKRSLFSQSRKPFPFDYCRLFSGPPVHVLARPVMMTADSLNFEATDTPLQSYGVRCLHIKASQLVDIHWRQLTGWGGGDSLPQATFRHSKVISRSVRRLRRSLRSDIPIAIALGSNRQKY
jgi:hypothetical protein